METTMDHDNANILDFVLRASFEYSMMSKTQVKILVTMGILFQTTCASIYVSHEKLKTSPHRNKLHIKGRMLYI